MSSVKVIYEDGVFKPLEKIEDLKPGQILEISYTGIIDKKKRQAILIEALRKPVQCDIESLVSALVVDDK